MWNQKICIIQIFETIISFTLCIMYAAGNCITVKAKKCNDLNRSVSNYSQMNRAEEIALYS